MSKCIRLVAISCCFTSECSFSVCERRQIIVQGTIVCNCSGADILNHFYTEEIETHSLRMASDQSSEAIALLCLLAQEWQECAIETRGRNRIKSRHTNSPAPVHVWTSLVVDSISFRSIVGCCTISLFFSHSQFNTSMQYSYFADTLTAPISIKHHIQSGRQAESDSFWLHLNFRLFSSSFSSDIMHSDSCVCEVKCLSASQI